MKKNNSKILFLCQFSYPEYNSSSTLPFDTARYFASQGYSVDIMCGYPKEYNRAGKVPIRETIDDVRIHRLRYMQLNRIGKAGRLINYFSYTMSALLHIIEMRSYDLIVCYSNPPILPVVAVWAAKIYRLKAVFVAYDVYPEIAYATGAISKGSIIDKLMAQLNHITYKNMSAIISLTDEMKSFLLSKRPELNEERAFVISNWAHEKRRCVQSWMYEKFGYQEGQFVVSYFGNMGICQDMDTLIKAAEVLADQQHIRFLFAGHGSKKAAVGEYVKEHALENVQIMDFLTGDDFEQALAVSSCCVVSLEPGLKGLCAPSKYYSYLQSGCAVIAIVEEGSYLAREIEEEEIGFHTEPGNVTELAERIRILAENSSLSYSMGRRAESLYDRKYCTDRAMKMYMRTIRNVMVGG